MKKSILHQSIVATVALTSIVWTNSLSHAYDPFAELDAASASAAEKSATKSRSQSTTATSELSEFEQFMTDHQDEYNDWEEQFLKEFEEFVKISKEETEKFETELKTVWDKPEQSSKTTWVDYSKDLKTKNRVDFEKGEIEISTTTKAGKQISDAELKRKLIALILKNRAEAFKADQVAQAIEARSKKNLKLLETAEVKPKPILIPYVTEKESPTKSEVTQIVDKMMAQKKKVVSTNKKGDQVVTMKVPLATQKKAKKMAGLRSNSVPKGAQQLSGDVKKYAKKHKIDESLVYAVIETESAYNPMAKSPIPAYGLMQIVPRSAGMDATAMLFGEGRILSPSYLYTGDKNIEIGTAYLHILYYRYLKKIENPQSRLYCAIAAYNTGAGNVSKAFIGSTKLSRAVPKINAMEPEQVYDHLIVNLPYAETRNYLKKVIARMPKYDA